MENGLLIHKLRKSQSTVICNQSFLTSLAQKRSKLSRFYLSISLDFFFISIVTVVLRQVVPFDSKADLSSSRFTFSRFHIE